VKIGGLFTRQLFGPNDSWNLPESGMNFHSRSDVERLLRGWTLLELTEEDRPAAYTKMRAGRAEFLGTDPDAQIVAGKCRAS
jgi:hypothetical protein